MIFQETPIPGAFIVDLEKHEDERGYFGRVWCSREFKGHDLNPNLAQANVSFNRKRGTMRGLHHQLPPHAETKLFKCTGGSIYDVIVDLREDSPKYCTWYGVELSAEKERCLYVPEGCAHGYLALTDGTKILYYTSEDYSPELERGIRYDDPLFDIKWPVRISVVSEKDRSWPDYVPKEHLGDFIEAEQTGDSR